MNWLKTGTAIYRRELMAFFFSPIYYVIAAAFMIIMGLMFYFSIGAGNPFAPPAPAELAPVFGSGTFFMLFMLPVVTMRLFAEEFRHGTIETLMTAPVSDWQVVLGKYCAAVTVVAAMFLPTTAYVVTLFVASAQGPDVGKLLVGYLAVLLAGGLFAAVGVLASTLTKDQVVAAILGILFNLSFWLVRAAGSFDSVRERTWLRETIEYVTFFRHFDNLIDGVVDSRDIIYFVSLTAFFLFVAVRVIESRKWRV